MNMNKRVRNMEHQAGSALLVSLVMLLIISLIGIRSMQGTALQERMASNLHDRNIAFQSSERALRTGEEWLEDNILAGVNNENEIPNWAGPWPNEVVVAGGDPQVSAEPVYELQFLGPVFQGGVPSLGGGQSGGSVPDNKYVVSSRGQGGSNTALAVLQSVYLTPGN